MSDKDWQSHYICQLPDVGQALEALRNQPRLLKTPIVRNDQQAAMAQWEEVSGKHHIHQGGRGL